MCLPSGYAPATDTSIYDALGQRVAVQQQEQLPSGTVSDTTRVFSYDGDGQILSRRDGTVSGGVFTALSGSTTANPDAMAPQHYVYAEGHQVAALGESGTIQTRDGLTPYSDPQSSSSYTVQAGDTLQSIAQTVYGNANLWYVIADANAISLDSSGNAINLVAGTTLKLPAVSNEQNSSQTFTPYNPLKLIGSTTPALAYIPPPPPQHCNDLTTLIVVAVTIAVTVYTAGAAAEAMGAEATGTTAAGVGATGAAAVSGGAMTLTGGTMAAALGSLGTDLVAAGIGGFAGSVAGQLTGQALGDGAGFSLKEALAGGLTGMASAELGALANGDGVVQAIAHGQVGTAALQGAATDLAGIAANRIVGLPSAFSWASVAAASLSSALSAAVVPYVLGRTLDPNTVSGDFAQGLTSGVIGRNVDLGFGLNTSSYGAIAADAFGNAIGNDLSGVDAYRQGQVQYQLQQAVQALSPAQHDNYTLLLQRGVAPAQALALATHLAAAPMMMLKPGVQQAVYAHETGIGSTLSGNATAAFWNAFGQSAQAGSTPLDAAQSGWEVAGLVPNAARVDQMSAKLATMSPLDTRYYPLQAEITALTTALISKDVYFNQSIPQILPNGITRLSSEGLAQSKLGSVLTASMLSDSHSGFFSGVYTDSNQRSPLYQSFIIADRGTQGGLLGPDWKNNLQQLIGADSQQYDEAAKVARLVLKSGLTNVVFTGHSLGGGLATLQSAITGLPAYTFNAAGVNDATFARAHAPYVQQLPQLVSAYYVDHELLSTLQDYSPAPSAEGTRIELAPVSFNSTTSNSEAPIPWYQDYNPSTMYALHSIVEVVHALEYHLNQLIPPSGGIAP